MALKNIYKATNTDSPHSLVIPEINKYLIGIANADQDRAIDVNAPSQIFGCKRANYFARTGEQNGEILDPRTMRIFGNGDHVHIRLQTYLLNCGVLLLDEVPVLNVEYNIQGHTDGVMNFVGEKIVLELKSINQDGFARLKSAKEEHIEQAMTYLFCLEERRKYLHDTYKTPEEFNSKQSVKERREFFTSRYQHMKSGSKFTRQQKINRQVSLNFEIDALLYDTLRPVTRISIVYENKNNQELKEFIVERDEEIVKRIKLYCTEMNEYVAKGIVPPAEGTSKSSPMCRWCSNTNFCFQPNLNKK